MSEEKKIVESRKSEPPAAFAPHPEDGKEEAKMSPELIAVHEAYRTLESALHQVEHAASKYREAEDNDKAQTNIGTMIISILFPDNFDRGGSGVGTTTIVGPKILVGGLLVQMMAGVLHHHEPATPALDGLLDALMGGRSKDKEAPDGK